MSISVVSGRKEKMKQGHKGKMDLKCNRIRVWRKKKFKKSLNELRKQ